MRKGKFDSVSCPFSSARGTGQARLVWASKGYCLGLGILHSNPIGHSSVFVKSFHVLDRNHVSGC